MNGTINLKTMTFKPDGMDSVKILGESTSIKNKTQDYGYGGCVEGKETVSFEKKHYLVEINGKRGNISERGDLTGKNRMRFKEFKIQ